jgi:type IV pilus assembly protein PilW
MGGNYCYPRPGIRAQSERSAQRGYTLIEIMVALTLGLVVIIGVIQVFISTQQSARIQQAASRMQEDGRMAMALLNRYLRLAGYTTHPWDKGNTTWNPAINARGFPANATFAAGQVVRGGENDVNGVDSIRIRYQGTADGSVTTCLGRVVPINEMADITFSLTADVPGQGRSLLCTDNNTNNAQPLVAGLQDMQIWYGLSQDRGAVAGIDANGRLTGATAYVPANLVPANEWNRVIGVRVSLLVRSEQDQLTLEPQTVTFNEVNIVPVDRRMRYVMGTTINVRNQAP